MVIRVCELSATLDITKDGWDSVNGLHRGQIEGIAVGFLMARLGGWQPCLKIVDVRVTEMNDHYSVYVELGG